MKLIRFELKKIWRQKRWLWLWIFALVCTAGLYVQNSAQQELMSERAMEKISPIKDGTNFLLNNLLRQEREETLDEQQAGQLETLKKMNTIMLFWTAAIDHKRWSEVPAHEGEFLQALQQFEEQGGQLQALTGLERELAIEKNTWLQDHQLAYEDEQYPLSPHLFLISNMDILFSLTGVAVLLLLFGTSFVAEKEQRTWLWLTTQPIPAWKFIVGKYSSVLLVAILYLITVIGIGLLFPLLFSEYSLHFNYPIVLAAEQSFTIISAIQVVGRGVLFFLCAVAVAFSLIFLFSALTRHTFSTLLLMAFTMIVGYVTTDMLPSIQSAFNPFQYFRFSHLLAEMPQSADWLYLVGALSWSFLFITLVLLFRERESCFFQRFFQREERLKPFNGGNIKTEDPLIWKLARFEWRKMSRKGLVKQLMLFLLLFIVLGYMLISQLTSQQEALYMETLKNRVTTYEYLISHFEAVEYPDEHTRKASDFLNETVAKIESALQGLEREEWLPLYEYQLLENQFANNELDTGRLSTGLKDHVGQFTIDVSIAEKHWLMERNLQPVFSEEYTPTLFQHWGAGSDTAKKSWEAENLRIDNSGMFSLFLSFDYYAYLLPLLTLFLVLGGGLASERGKKSTLHLLKTQPLSMTNLYLGKVLHTLLISLLSGGGVLGVLLVLGTLFNRFGDWHYPVLHYDHPALIDATYTGTISAGNGFHLMALGQYVIHSSMLFLLALLFLMMLAIGLSLFVKHVLSVFASGFLIAALGYFGSTQLFPGIAHLSPFTYFNIPTVPNGEASIVLNNPNISVQTGSFVLATATVLLLVAGMLLLKIQGRKANHSLEREEYGGQKYGDEN